MGAVRGQAVRDIIAGIRDKAATPYHADGALQLVQTHQRGPCDPCHLLASHWHPGPTTAPAVSVPMPQRVKIGLEQYPSTDQRSGLIALMLLNLSVMKSVKARTRGGGVREGERTA